MVVAGFIDGKSHKRSTANPTNLPGEHSAGQNRDGARPGRIPFLYEVAEFRLTRRATPARVTIVEGFAIWRYPTEEWVDYVCAWAVRDDALLNRP